MVRVVVSARPDPHVPHPHRLGLGHPHREEILRHHTASVAAGRPSYRDPVSGLAVFTAAFLLARGTCCDSGCRHCPFVGAPPGEATDPG